MKLSKEIKTAILVILSIILFIWGYSFLKGKDLLTSYKTLYVKYQNVEGLNISAPVTINGLVIGKVNNIVLQKDWTSVVEIQVHEDYDFAVTSLAELYAPSPIGNKQIAIIPDTKNSVLAKTGDFLLSSSKLGLTDALALQMEPLKDKIERLLDNANGMLQAVNQTLDVQTQNNLKKTIASLQVVMDEFKDTSKSINTIMVQNQGKINGIVSNLDHVSSNFSKVSDSLSKIKMVETMAKLDKTVTDVNAILSDIQAGKGSMGKLMKDESLYKNFSNTSRELELLLQDVRLYPTRYVNVSVFGKKNKPYKLPEHDPAKTKDTIN